MSALPSGTVTFLFTDIEGSTRRWDSDRAAMSVALARHDDLLREAIESAGGTVFKTMGDAFCAVFDSASDGVAAALVAQRVLDAEDWATCGAGFVPLKVRMALHAGEAEARGGDWFGPPLNRVARLLAAGHGGQVLLSDAARVLLIGALPVGAALRDLGERRLKDLRAPERVWQLTAPDLMADFPPLVTLDARPNNLPGQLTGLIGREADVAQVAGLLRAADGPRLVTLTGPGGTGKTRLGLQAAAELIDDFDHGVWWVDLTALAHEDLVIPAICSALGLDLEPKRTPEEQLAEHLAARRQLLLLDNFEQVVEAAPAVVRLLAGAPGIRVLATSRVALRVRGERTVLVLPLAVPDAAAGADLERLAQFGAVQMFVQRATEAREGFQLTADTAPAVAGICVRLEGLPLAIELAAARVRLMDPRALLARLDSQLMMLVGGHRDLPRRQQTMRGAITWSYDLLTAEQQRLFRRLGVFRGGWTEEAAVAVAAGVGDVAEEGEDGALGAVDGDIDVDVLEGLAALLDASLIRRDDRPAPALRFTMLETLREFAVEQLLASPERERMLERHLAYYLDYFERADKRLPDEAPEQQRRRTESDRDNLRAALDHGESETASAELAIRLAQRHNGILGDVREAARRMTALLARHGAAASPATVAWAQWSRGILAWFVADFKEAEQHFFTGLALAREAGDRQLESWCLNELGNQAHVLGRFDEAEARMTESIEVKRQLGDWRDVAIGVMNLGCQALSRGDASGAKLRFVEALGYFREAGHANISGALVNLAMAELYLGHTEEMRLHLDEGLRLAEAERNLEIMSLVYSIRALADLQGGDASAARRQMGTALRLSVEAEWYQQVPDCAELAARAAALLARPFTAARVAGAVAAWRDHAGMMASAIDRTETAADLAVAETAIGPEAYARAFARGGAMSQETLIAYTLAFLDGEEVPPDDADDDER